MAKRSPIVCLQSLQQRSAGKDQPCTPPGDPERESRCAECARAGVDSRGPVPGVARPAVRPFLAAHMKWVKAARKGKPAGGGPVRRAAGGCGPRNALLEVEAPDYVGATLSACKARIFLVILGWRSVTGKRRPRRAGMRCKAHRHERIPPALFSPAYSLDPVVWPRPCLAATHSCSPHHIPLALNAASSCCHAACLGMDSNGLAGLTRAVRTA